MEAIEQPREKDAVAADEPAVAQREKPPRSIPRAVCAEISARHLGFW